MASTIAIFGSAMLVFRVQREMEMAGKGERNWIPWADWLLLGATITSLLLAARSGRSLAERNSIAQMAHPITSSNRLGASKSNVASSSAKKSRSKIGTTLPPLTRAQASDSVAVNPSSITRRASADGKRKFDSRDVCQMSGPLWNKNVKPVSV